MRDLRTNEPKIFDQLYKIIDVFEMQYSLLLRQQQKSFYLLFNGSKDFSKIDRA